MSLGCKGHFQGLCAVSVCLGQVLALWFALRGLARHAATHLVCVPSNAETAVQRGGEEPRHHPGGVLLGILSWAAALPFLLMT